MIIRVFTFLSLLLFFTACSDSDIEVMEAVGYVRDAPANYEDCGWVIDVDGTFYQPTYLSSDYQQDGFRVYMTFEDLNEDPGCQAPGESLRRIRVIQIRPR